MRALFARTELANCAREPIKLRVCCVSCCAFGCLSLAACERLQVARTAKRVPRSEPPLKARCFDGGAFACVLGNCAHARLKRLRASASLHLRVFAACAFASRELKRRKGDVNKTVVLPVATLAAGGKQDFDACASRASFAGRSSKLRVFGWRATFSRSALELSLVQRASEERTSFRRKSTFEAKTKLAFLQLAASYSNN